MTERQERCETCRFWEVFDDREPLERLMQPEIVALNPELAGLKVPNDDRQGWCHRYPPSVIHEAHEDPVFPWSPTDDWCGEYQPTPPAAATRAEAEPPVA